MAMLLVFAVILLSPLSLVKVDQRGAALNTLVIQLDRSSPAFAAFDDLQEDFVEVTQNEVLPVRQVTLKSGKIFEPEILPEASPVLRITLHRMKIQRSVTSLKTMHIAQEKVKANIDWDNSESLPSLADRKRILMNEVSKDELLTPSASEVAEELVKKTLAMTTPEERKLPTEAGGVIVVKKPDSSGTTEDRSPYVANYRQALRTAAREGAKDSENGESGEILVTGSVLVDGVGGPRWKVYRTLNGKILERGSMNVMGAQFSIRVREKRGYVVAEVGDEFGKVSGRGRVSLESNSDLALNVKPIDEAPTIAAVSPAFIGASSAGGSAIDASYKIFGNSIDKITTGKALDVSSYSDDSRVLLEAEAPEQFASLAIGFLSRLKGIPLYSLKAMKAFYQIVKSFYRPIDIQNYALLWGKVLKDGQPISGAEVELASNEGQLVYFNEIGIPRKDLLKTTALGQFAVVNVSQGVQSLRVRFQGETYPAQVVPTSNGKVTHLNLEIPSEAFKHELRVHSILDPEGNLPVTGRILGQEASFDLESLDLIELPSLDDGLTMEFDGGPDYELLRAHLPKLVGGTSIAFPMIPYSWLDQLLREAGKTLDRRLGWAMGFSEGGDEEVRLLGQNDDFHQVVYFDKERKLSLGSTVPPEGGYLIFNIPLGFQSVEVRGINASQSYVESFVSEPYFLHLVGSQSLIKPLGQENL
ncbi:carboxypeptidase regulatory-like domain-containing protein [bacterium]|nr:carboxypeptidase regulatory-like domain-containing protein [bacterium]